MAERWEVALVIVVILGAVGRQLHRHEVVGAGRFRLPVIFGAAGLLLGGLRPPDAFWPAAVFGTGLLGSVVIGYARGRWSRVWIRNERVYTQGTVLTVGLFTGLLITKLLAGAFLYLSRIHTNAGLGEVLIMAALMTSISTELVWRRAQDPRLATRPVAPAVP